MSSISVATPSRSRAKVRGWRSRYSGDFPTLGWGLLDWTYAYLPDPNDDREPFRYTDEQARRLLRYYQIDPITGQRLFNQWHIEESKGWGKSPYVGTIDLGEFCGPVCFDGWDADGQPVGVPWGTGGRPPPWVQIAAVSEDQTGNTYHAMYALLVARNHYAARQLRIDEGRTRLYLRDIPGGRLEPVTASFGSREGQRLTHVTIDEPQLWLPSNGGPKLARTLLRNLTKMDGSSVFTGNSPVEGERSVAETFAKPAPGVLFSANRASRVPQPDEPDEALLELLGEAYEGVPWVNTRRVLADVRNTSTHPWDESLRFFFNLRTPGVEKQWMDSPSWAALAGAVEFVAGQAVYVAVVLSPDNRQAGIAAAQRVALEGGTGVRVSVRSFPEVVADDDPEYLELAPLEEYLLELRRAHPAAVWHVRRPNPAVAEQRILAAGPEMLYHSAYFEGSAQHLASMGMTVRYVPFSPTRLRQAADVLMEQVTDKTVTHDGAGNKQVGLVVETDSAYGPKIGAQEGRRAPAAFATMLAVHRALTAPVPPAPEPPVYGSFR